MKYFRTVLLLVAAGLFLSSGLYAQRSIYEPLDISKVEYSFDDFGTMWTYDAVPKDVYEKELGFRPTDQWLNDVRQSALELGNGCSASFVSSDGLIMTNHHCVRGMLQSVEQEGENIHKDGFYAENPEDERRIPNLYADRLTEIKDVTNQIHTAMDMGTTDSERVELKNETIIFIQDTYARETGNVCKVITLYNGGKYSLHIYERFEDIRLVMVPDVQIAAAGWDWDNFTYPRYELDFAFLRAYDAEGKPIVTDKFFRYNTKGAEDGEAVFVSGRPGNTDRLVSTRQLEYFRDTRHPIILHRLNEVYGAYFEYFKENPDKQSKLLSRLLSVANGRKAYAGMLMGLKDEYLMAKKYDFEKTLQKKVESSKGLSSEYAGLWDNIAKVIDELAEIENELLVYQMAHYYSSSYQETAQNLIEAALVKDLKPSSRDKVFAEAEEEELQKLLLQAHERFLRKTLGEDCKYLQTLYGNKQAEAAVEYFLEHTELDDEAYADALVAKGRAGIESSTDPLVNYAYEEFQRMNKYKDRRKELQDELQVLNQQLGFLIFKVFGDKIPPDATASLRISHGRIKGYEYNGTLAPGKTTYYGLWDRYYSFGETDYPWGLHERWKEVPQGLDLSIDIGFASTNDIVGGNSGSAFINRNAEVVGLVHDGNLESLAGSYAFLRENNRSVATDSHGMIEALRLVYKTKRLVKELETGKMQP